MTNTNSLLHGHITWRSEGGTVGEALRVQRSSVALRYAFSFAKRCSRLSPSQLSQGMQGRAGDWWRWDGGTDSDDDSDPPPPQG